MQTWAAAFIVIGQGIFLLIALKILKAFGVYVEVIVSAQRQNLKIRENMAIQENDRAIAEVLHTHRRSTDPPLEQEREA